MGGFGVRWGCASWFTDGHLLIVSSHGGKGKDALCSLWSHPWGGFHPHGLVTSQDPTWQHIGHYALTCEFGGTHTFLLWQIDFSANRQALHCRTLGHLGSACRTVPEACREMYSGLSPRTLLSWPAGTVLQENPLDRIAEHPREKMKVIACLRVIYSFINNIFAICSNGKLGPYGKCFCLEPGSEERPGHHQRAVSFPDVHVWSTDKSITLLTSWNMSELNSQPV